MVNKNVKTQDDLKVFAFCSVILLFHFCSLLYRPTPSYLHPIVSNSSLSKRFFASTITWFFTNFLSAFQSRCLNSSHSVAITTMSALLRQDSGELAKVIILFCSNTSPLPSPCKGEGERRTVPLPSSFTEFTLNAVNVFRTGSCKGEGGRRALSIARG